MLPSLFKEKEEVQVLDEVTYIWEAARILGFISNWGVSVKWTEWKGPPVQITIPEDLRDNRRMKHWKIRKTIKVVEEPDRAKRRNKKDPLLFNPRRLTRNTDVFFCAACETDCVDKCILMTGVVLYNDPFKRECTLRILDSEHDENPREEPEANILVVKYNQLRNQGLFEDTLTSETSFCDTATLVLEPCEVQDHQRNPTKRAKKDEKEIDMLTLLEATEDIVPLTFVPCSNGVLKVGSTAFYGGENCRVDSLEFEGRTKKAFAQLTCINNEDISIRMPALLVQLACEDYLKHETCDFNAIEHPINLSFAVFSALKRAVGLARDKNSITFNLGPVTKLTRQIMGFSTESQKEVVKFSAAISEGIRGCHKSWDSVLGSRWDVLPAQKDNGHDTLIKYLRITEHREFTSFNLRCNVQTCTGHYASEEDYRTLFSHNLEQSKPHYFY